MIKRIIAVAALLVGLIVVIRYLPEKQKWLLLAGHSAERYGNALLVGDLKKQEKYQDNFIDYVVVTDPRTKTVLFSPHENHECTFIYAPSHTEHDFEYQSRKATKIVTGWYFFK